MQKLTFRSVLLLLLLISVGFFAYIQLTIAPINDTNQTDSKFGTTTSINNGELSTTTGGIDPVKTTTTTVTNSTTTTTTVTPGTGLVPSKPTFSGKLESVNTGCFSDGECYVMVSGKHVTVLRGWSQAVVGSTLGVEGFGDLESHIGETVEVYAEKDSEGKYTLYGNADYYVKLLKTTSGSGTATSSEPKPVVEAGCMIGGCSGEMCVDADSEQAVSTCIYREEFACYKKATCAKQTGGKCGWTQTEDLKMCIAKAS